MRLVRATGAAVNRESASLRRFKLAARLTVGPSNGGARGNNSARIPYNALRMNTVSEWRNRTDMGFIWRETPGSIPTTESDFFFL